MKLLDHTIITSDGLAFDLEDPENANFDIEVIAHALSQIARFGGHARWKYSVAQHSVLVSFLVPEGDELAGLMHDAQEAFIGDVVSPLKRLLPEYIALEQRFESSLRRAFGFEVTPGVKAADHVAYLVERVVLFGMEPSPEIAGTNCHALIERMTDEAAAEAFLHRFNQLKK